MEIVYGNAKIRKKCTDAKGKLKRRLDDIRAAESMAILETLPGHHHLLTANRSGQWACPLEEPYRLIFEPVADPLPVSTAGRLDTSKVFAVRLIEVVDYHG